MFNPRGDLPNAFRMVAAGLFFLAMMFSRTASGGQMGTIPELIESATVGLDAERLPDPERSIKELQIAIDTARWFLERNTDQSNYSQWLEYLDFEAVETGIKDKVSSSVLAKEAIALRYRLVGLTPGLELTVLRNVRSAANQFVSAARFRNRPRTIQALEKEMISVARAIRDQSGSAVTLSPETTDRLAELLRLLVDGDQVPDLVASLRGQFSIPNIRVLVDERLVTEVATRAVNQNQSVDQCILGTRVIGDATITGGVTSDLLPSSDGIRLQLTLNGRFDSRNRGYNGPVVLNTVGYGNVMATRTLDLDFSGARLGTTFVRVAIDTDVLSIMPKRRFGRRLIHRIASKRVAKQKPQADRIAADRLRIQVGEQFNQSSSESSRIQMPDLLGRFSPQIKRLEIATPTRNLYSTDREIFFESRLQRDDQLSASVFPPVKPSGGDLTFQIHESLIVNAVGPVLAGRTLNRDRIADLIEQSGLKLPTRSDSSLNPGGLELPDDQGEDSDDADEPFEIEFARSRPIIFEARDGKVRLGVRGARFASGDRELKQALEITATYSPVIQLDGTSILVRQGEAEVDFIGKKRLSIAQAGMRGTIEKRFAKVFPPQLLTNGLTVPQTARAEALRGREFRAQRIDASQGWFSVSAR